MKKPNIIFILIDDMGWKDLSCCGSTFYETPHIDQLSAQGMRFTDAYASCPVCSPTRASVMTGKYPATVGITDWINWGGSLHPARGRLIDVPYLKDLPTCEHTVAGALKETGYATWHVGKWHLGGEGHMPQDHGFDVNIGGCQTGSPGHGGYFSPWSIPVLENADVPEGTYLTDYLTDQAIEQIRNKGEAPFFLNLWYYSVHTPIQAKPEKIKKYEAKTRAMGLDTQKTFEEGEFYPCEHKKDKRILRRLIQSDPVYAAMIESLDENIGRLMSALEETGEMDNTLIIFTSDNGGLATSEGSPTCNAPLAEGKGWMYEGGTREPLFVKWPGVVEPGAVCHTPVTTPDFYPTMLEAAGTDGNPDHQVDGVSIMPLLKGVGVLKREAIFWHYPHYGNQGGTPVASVRKGDYKLINFFEDDRLELYNLREDPGETRNLNEGMPDLARELKGLLSAWQKKVEAKIPQPNPDWENR
ncbi:MAG: sulfatase [Gemmatimonadota bacterium]|nr:sulfatase [Gemmatimonadota bacterium]